MDFGDNSHPKRLATNSTLMNETTKWLGLLWKEGFCIVMIIKAFSV